MEQIPRTGERSLPAALRPAPAGAGATPGAIERLRLVELEHTVRALVAENRRLRAALRALERVGATDVERPDHRTEPAAAPRPAGGPDPTTTITDRRRRTSS